MQNDPWSTNAIIIGIPTFLSIANEFKDLSMLLEDKNIRFFSINMREQSWNGNCNKINLGTIIGDIDELIRCALILYPGNKVFLLGQGFGGQLAYHIYKKNNLVNGLIIANPLVGTSGINFMKFTYLSYSLEVLNLKHKLQFFDVREVLPRLEKMTNNRSYKKEIKELFERKYIHGIPLKYIAQCRWIIDSFWKEKSEIKSQDWIYWITTSEDSYQKTNDSNFGKISALGNHLVFTDYINDDVITNVVNWTNMKIN